MIAKEFKVKDGIIKDLSLGNFNCNSIRDQNCIQGMAMKSSRNKTINIGVEESISYISKCISIDSPKTISDIIDRTILGNTFEVLPMLPKKFVDLLIVDPPYNLNKNFNGNKFKKIPDDEYDEYTETWVQAIIPVNRITWQREKGRGALTNWKNGMEDIWFATKSNSYTFNVNDVKIRRKVIAPYKIDGMPKDWEDTAMGKFRNTYPSNFWDDISIPYWSMPENTTHPTQKPEKLLAKLILASSNHGDIVFDPFLGSGTTSVVSKKLKRHYLGIEINEQYCALAEKRLEMAENNTSIQGYVNGVFWERNTKPHT